MQSHEDYTYEDKCAAPFVQRLDTLFLIYPRHNEKRILWRGHAFLGPQLHSGLCKLQRILCKE